MQGLNVVIEYWQKLFSGSAFRQNFLKLAQAQIFAQLIALVAAPFLTRLFSPEAFGVAAIFASVVGFFSAFSTWRVEWSIPNTSSKVQAAALFYWGSLVLLGVTFCFTGISLLQPDWIFVWNGMSSIQPYLFLLPFAILGIGLRQLIHAWHIKSNDLRVIAQTNLFQSVSNTGFSFLTGYSGFSLSGLLLSSVLSAWVGLGILFRGAKDFSKSLARLTPLRKRITFYKYFRESTLSSCTSLINTLSLSLTPIFFAQFFSDTEIGWYAMMQRLSLAPIALVTHSLSQSFWSEAALLYKANTVALKKLYLRMSRYLFFAALPVCFVCFMGPAFVGKILGEQWEPAGFVLQALTPFLLGQIIVSPLSHLIVHGKQHWQLAWDFVRTVLLLGILFSAYHLNLGFVSSLWMISYVMLIMYVLLFGLNLLCINDRINK